MKLTQVYANRSFKRVLFKNGVNVIVGKVTVPLDFDKDSHNLGKSTLIDVIDFVALKDIDKDHFLKRRADKFSEYVFFLEIELNDGRFLTIRRSVEKSTKISFKFSDRKHVDQTNCEEWDYLDVPIKRAQRLLNELLAFSVLKEWSYRDTITYFLRSQRDYLDVLQLSKYSFGDSVWKPLVFALLGFDSYAMEEKYKTDTLLKKQNEWLDEQARRSALSADDTDRIKGLIQLKEDERNALDQALNKFDFYDKEKLLNVELVAGIENAICKLNSLQYSIEYETNKITSSLKEAVDFDFEVATQIFEEANVHFPQQLKKSYEQLLEFNRAVSEERRGYLKERLKFLNEQKESNDRQLLELNQKRQESLTYVHELDSFNKFKNYQKDVARFELEIAKLKGQLDIIKSLTVFDDKKKELEIKIDDFKKRIRQQIDQGNDLYTIIRRTYSSIIKQILGRQALLSIATNKEGNAEFQIDIQTDDGTQLTAEGDGNTYKKMLCVAFDLSILKTYSEGSFFKFVYHDGVLEALDNRMKMKFITFIYDLCEKHGIQYILTIIEDDLPRNEHGQKIHFNGKDVVLELTDEGDEGRLFEQRF